MADVPAHEELKKKVLNVGGNNKEIPIPDFYQGWTHHLLDIDPQGKPDIVCDARQLTRLEAGQYDSVYCSHNLEHYYRHDGLKVLHGFLHVLKDDGFTYIQVPDMAELVRVVAQHGLDIDDVLYDSPSGPITVHDFIYGFGRQLASSGNDYYAHKAGFTEKSLTYFLHQAGFTYVYAVSGKLNVNALAFKAKPSRFYQEMFGIIVEY